MMRLRDNLHRMLSGGLEGESQMDPGDPQVEPSGEHSAASGGSIRLRRGGALS